VLSDAKLSAKVTHDDVAGSTVGTTSVNGRDMQVMAKRTFGPPEGFSNKFQAISEARLAGVERMHERPIGDLVDALRSLGADIRYLGREGFPPLEIRPATPAVRTKTRSAPFAGVVG